MKLTCGTPLHLMSVSTARAHLRVARKIKGHYMTALLCGKNPGHLHDICNPQAAGDLLYRETVKNWNWSVIEAEARAGIAEELRTDLKLNELLNKFRAEEAAATIHGSREAESEVLRLQIPDPT